jgi:hypothetical protein
VAERFFKSCIACGGRLSGSWFIADQIARPKRWGYALRFGGRGRIASAPDLDPQYLVARLAPSVVRNWLGSEYANQMAAAVFAAALALEAAGWSMAWVMADAKALERLRYLEAIYGRYGAPVQVYETQRPSWAATFEDHTARTIDVSPRIQGEAVLEYEGSLGGATLEEVDG